MNRTDRDPNIISLVGGGGKTTTMFGLAERFAAEGKRVLVTTTTHIRLPERCFAADPAEVSALWAQGRYAVCGTPVSDSKLSMPPEDLLQRLMQAGKQALAASLPADPGAEGFEERLLLRDILLTQQAVLSAMLYAYQEKPDPEGVLITEAGESQRIPARPMPERELWFEQVWKQFREGRYD